MNESSKTNQIRPPSFAANYLQGRLIDIGAGNDLVCDWAEGFDVGDGDANFISRFRTKESYDAVHSSHCLEHMTDPRHALTEWWSLLKPGGHMVTVVPDEDLYEQRHWPSLFNGDHKWTFTRERRQSWSPRSVEVTELFARLPGCEVISVELQEAGYDRRLLGTAEHRPLPIILVHALILVRRIPVLGRLLQRWLFRLLHAAGFAVDQTLGDALAQIQIVARKHPRAQAERSTDG